MRSLFEVEIFPLEKCLFYEEVRKGDRVSYLAKNALTRSGKKLALLQLLISFTVVITGTLITYFMLGVSSAQSVFTGGAVAIIPNAVFAFKAFKYAGATSSKKVVESFFSGVKIKMLLTAFLFALAFKFLVITPLPFLIMFCVVMFLPLLMPLILSDKLLK